jgi:hypothetical protein
VRTFTRVFQLKTSQVVERWGNIDPNTGKPDFMDGRPSNLSATVQDQWRRGNFNAPVDVVHIVQPNRAYDDAKFESKYKRYECVYYEAGATDTGLLEHTGFDEFPC